MKTSARHSRFEIIVSVGSGQFLATYNKGKSFGKAWDELDVDRPGPPEEEEDQQ